MLESIKTYLVKILLVSVHINKTFVLVKGF